MLLWLWGRGWLADCSQMHTPDQIRFSSISKEHPWSFPCNIPWINLWNLLSPAAQTIWKVFISMLVSISLTNSRPATTLISCDLRTSVGLLPYSKITFNVHSSPNYRRRPTFIHSRRRVRVLIYNLISLPPKTRHFILYLDKLLQEFLNFLVLTLSTTLHASINVSDYMIYWH